MNAHRRKALARLAKASLAMCAVGGRGSAWAGIYLDFFRAVNVDNAGGVKQALDRGMDPNARSEQGQHALYLAIRDESPKVVALLLSWPGVDLDAANSAGETPLMMAALKGDLPVMNELLAKGVPAHRTGWSPLHYAATGPSTDAVRLLLERGAPVDAESANRSTPLMMAARYGAEPSVELLVQRGADMSRRNDRQLDAWDFARNADRDWMLRSLDKPRKR
jgi:ankyrin repeat protein